MDRRREEALKAAQRCAEYLKARYGVKRVIPFGSVVGDGPWHEGSDLDLAVEGLAPEHFFRAWSELHNLVPKGLVLDLVPLEDAPPELRARILGEVKMPEEPMQALKSLIEDELRTLERLVKRMEELLGSSSEPPTWVELQAMGSLLHGFYTGVESILRRIALRVDGSLPKGEMWHIELLTLMTQDIPKRPAVIDWELWGKLKAYLDFRHFFRHAYGVDLEWERMRSLVEGMREVFDEFEGSVRLFLERVTSGEADESTGQKR